MNVFVFGSNLAGRHGKGAALFAKENFGAIYGQGIGLQGESYAIPTKDADLLPLPLHVIHHHVYQFIKFAMIHPDYTFNVTRVGCGLAGYEDSQIGPMFDLAPKNCLLPPEWDGYRKGAKK